MKEKKNGGFSEFIVGAFMLAVAALLAYFTIVISGVDVLKGREKVMVKIAFSSAGGLKSHDSVMYRGTKVGGVEDIIVTPSNVLVVAEIDNNVTLRSSYRVKVANLSMLGGNYLVLEEGAGEIIDMYGCVLKGDDPSDWMRDVSEIAKNLRDITSSGELKTIITNLESASVSIKRVLDRVERGEGTVGKLLSEDETVYTGLKSAVTDISAVAKRVNNGEGTIGKLLSTNDTVYIHLQNTIAKASAIADRLSNEKLLDDLDSGVSAFKTACESMDMTETVKSANGLLEKLNAVAEKLKSGEGTIGKLVNNDDLYQEVDGLVKDVRQVIDNFRDTTPITTFGSLIMGGL
jgi:phospholipid/cholesterol/gamma-HCH transport system substrate-binding protein